MRQWSVPSEVADVQSFLGLASYYCRFIVDYAEIAALLPAPPYREVSGKDQVDRQVCCSLQFPEGEVGVSPCVCLSTLQLRVCGGLRC